MSSEVLNELMRRSEFLSDEEKMLLASHLAGQAGKSGAGGADLAVCTDDNGDPNKPDPERRREHQWLLQHADKYAGQWVALSGDRLLSHGIDGRRVLSEARRAGVAVPFVVRVEKPDELPFGGW